MRMLARQIVLVAAVLGLGGGAVGQARADSITYLETGVGSGSLGGTAFANAAFTLGANADTSQVSVGSLFTVQNSLLTLSVSGIPGTFAFTFNSRTFDNTSTNTVGFLSGSDILDVANPAFASYDLRSSIGPISGTPIINAGFGFPTSGGSFILNSVSSVTFQAAVGTTAVPEPSSIISAATGVLILLNHLARVRERAAEGCCSIARSRPKPRRVDRRANAPAVS